jgi:hypothetical protein
MANKAYYKRQLNEIRKRSKNIDAIVIAFNSDTSCVVIDNANNKTAVVSGEDVTYFRKRLQRVFKDCLIFEDSTKYE